MPVLHSPADARHLADPALRALVRLRLRQLSAGEVPGPPCCAVVAEPGDTAERLEEAVGFPVVHVFAHALPRQSDHQRLQLLERDRHLSADLRVHPTGSDPGAAAACIATRRCRRAPAP